MKKFKHLDTIVTFESGAAFWLTTFDKLKRLRYWLVTVDLQKDESEWLVRVFSVSYYGKYYDVRVLNTVYVERLVCERNSPFYVAKLVFRHYLTSFAGPGSEELPF